MHLLQKVLKELGKDYGMNWDEQIAKLEEYLVEEKHLQKLKQKQQLQT